MFAFSLLLPRGRGMWITEAVQQYCMDMLCFNALCAAQERHTRLKPVATANP